ncbi:hypothetical protein SAMN05443252_10560 [Bacillus sp. OV322]|uniref:hypothetical protein n=1 Tax=Bacillus sp. OV322 TaxID=1882764 RepID=UPI0008E8ADFA|nr:hypothetical protein [Bacillus sp. OV322]SFC64794.1 hypothetical protein SAMN05443252_10560 [Bacillus sp. OV322]
MSNCQNTPREPDVVTILWQRNPLRLLEPRTIVEATIIGSANPCRNDLDEGSRLRDAVACLLRSGFLLVSSTDLGIFGVSVFIRQRL